MVRPVFASIQLWQLGRVCLHIVQNVHTRRLKRLWKGDGISEAKSHEEIVMIKIFLSIILFYYFILFLVCPFDYTAVAGSGKVGP